MKKFSNRMKARNFQYYALFRQTGTKISLEKATHNYKQNSMCTEKFITLGAKTLFDHISPPSSFYSLIGNRTDGTGGA